MKARELLKTDVKVGTLVDINGVKGIIIYGGVVEKEYVVNGKAIVLLDRGLLGLLAYTYLNYEAKIIKKMVLG